MIIYGSYDKDLPNSQAPKHPKAQSQVDRSIIAFQLVEGALQLSKP